MPIKLDRRPRRSDLTDRECASILGGTIGVLIQNADPENVKRAVQWWAELGQENWHAIVMGSLITVDPPGTKSPQADQGTVVTDPTEKELLHAAGGHYCQNCGRVLLREQGAFCPACFA